MIGQDKLLQAQLFSQAMENGFTSISRSVYYRIEGRLIRSFSLHYTPGKYSCDIRFGVSAISASDLPIGEESIPLSAFSSKFNWGGYRLQQDEPDRVIEEIVGDVTRVIFPFYHKCTDIRSALDELLTLLNNSPFKKESFLLIPDIYDLATECREYDLMYQCRELLCKNNRSAYEQTGNKRALELIQKQEQEISHIRLKDDDYFDGIMRENEKKNKLKLKTIAERKA